MIGEVKQLKINTIIPNEDVYRLAKERVYDLMQIDLAPDSKESDELELIGLLVEQYESEHYPILDVESITKNNAESEMKLRSVCGRILGEYLQHIQ